MKQANPGWYFFMQLENLAARRWCLCLKSSSWTRNGKTSTRLCTLLIIKCEWSCAGPQKISVVRPKSKILSIISPSGGKIWMITDKCCDSGCLRVSIKYPIPVHERSVAQRVADLIVCTICLVQKVRKPIFTSLNTNIFASSTETLITKMYRRCRLMRVI